MSLYDENQQKGLIITDDISLNPVLDFELYRDAIVNIIKKSYPKFTIGIFGDWGTGKTTLMYAIDKVLQEDGDFVMVRYESWRYEREEQFALIPLLKSVAFALPPEPYLKDLKLKLKRGAINLAKKTPDIVSYVISKYIGDAAGEISKEGFNAFKGEFNNRMELLAEIDKDTMYFDGFEEIKKEIQKIRREINANFRIIVFVDDLDRCSQKKLWRYWNLSKYF